MHKEVWMKLDEAMKPSVCFLTSVIKYVICEGLESTEWMSKTRAITPPRLLSTPLHTMLNQGTAIHTPSIGFSELPNKFGKALDRIGQLEGALVFPEASD
jgi:hypothetical protein